MGNVFVTIGELIEGAIEMNVEAFQELLQILRRFFNGAQVQEINVLEAVQAQRVSVIAALNNGGDPGLVDMANKLADQERMLLADFKQKIEAFYAQGPVDKVLKKNIIGLQNVIRNVQIWNQRRETLPKGVLLMGPPGCGKTLIAKYMAGSCNFNFRKLEFKSLRTCDPRTAVKILDTAVEWAETMWKETGQTTVLFFDEMDKLLGGNSEIAIALTGQLNEIMDGITVVNGIVFVGALNNPTLLDPGLKERFSKKICFPLPTTDFRREFFEMKLRDFKNSCTADEIKSFVEKTPKFSYRSLNDVVKEGYTLSLMEGDDELNSHHILAAISLILQNKQEYSGV